MIQIERSVIKGPRPVVHDPDNGRGTVAATPRARRTVPAYPLLRGHHSSSAHRRPLCGNRVDDGDRVRSPAIVHFHPVGIDLVALCVAGRRHIQMIEYRDVPRRLTVGFTDGPGVDLGASPLLFAEFDDALPSAREAVA